MQPYILDKFDYFVTGMENFRKPKNIHVLVVDDNGMSRLLPGLILRPFGFNVHESFSVKDTIEILDQVDVSVVLVDINMPETDGYEILKLIQSHPTSKPSKIIAYTADVTPAIEAQMQKKGFDAVLMKPLTSQNLFLVLRDFFPVQALLRSSKEAV